MAFYSADPVRFESVSAVTATPSVEVGTRCQVGKESYVYVYNDGGSQISPGQGAILSTNTGFSVTVSSITQIDHLVGICKHATITTGAYGWLVQNGFVPLKVPSAISAGDQFTLGVDGNMAAIITAPTAPTVPTRIWGKCLQATGAGGVGYGFVSVGF